jgi:hypothetical protein
MDDVCPGTSVLGWVVHFVGCPFKTPSDYIAKILKPSVECTCDMNL